MKISPTVLPEVLILEPRVFRDERGYFLETWSQIRYRDEGLPEKFVQDNLSCSAHGVLRGLHFQNPFQQGKLVCVLQGEVFDVAVDIRVGSPTFGRWVSCVLSGENLRQMYIPEGFAHGFCVTSERALFVYKCTEYYSPASEISIRWDDLDIGIHWPVPAPALSPKDAAAPLLRDIPRDRLPVWINPAAPA
jgi:dTDP-4-dehydrorhamnose 3,5-epimerase